LNSKDLSNPKHSSLTGVIAEIGNHHFGSLKKAKELIFKARACGADFVKMQAIDANVVSHYGTMDPAFYRACEFTTEQYFNCYVYGKTIGVKVFFSHFGTKHLLLNKINKNMHFKISGKQFSEYSIEELRARNDVSTVISIPELKDIAPERIRAVSRMSKMFVTPYLVESVNFDNILRYNLLFNSEIGYSDHTLGIDNCKTAIEKYGCRLIEKHFHFGDVITWNGKKYRDCDHAATPEEFEELTRFFKRNVTDAMSNLS
jgi:N,N'-diacetyllegionaminate synthase